MGIFLWPPLEEKPFVKGVRKGARDRTSLFDGILVPEGQL